MSEQNTDKKYTVNFLDDDTTDDDAFGGHQRIADTLRDIIRTTKKGKSIALLGDYGSGKSSVIKMMTKGLPEDIKVFTYDAWAHQGDHLRRSFLETLIKFLCETDGDWLNEQDTTVKDIRAKFQGSTSVTQTMPEYRLTTLSWIVLLWTLLLPVGYKLLGNNAVFGISQDMGFPVSHTQLGIAILVFPVFIIFLEWMLKSFSASSKMDEKSGGKERKSKSLIYLLINKGVEETTSITNAQSDPSSVDFQNDYKRILRHVLEGNPSRKLVLVIDNLDRVDLPEARDIWATMQTFCNIECRENDNDVRNRVWLIVPIADTFAQTLWGMEGSNKAKENIVPGYDHNKGLDQHFIEKNFQIALRVPPPVIGKWKQYFLDALRQAIPPNSLQNAEAEYEKVYLAYSARQIFFNPLPNLPVSGREKENLPYRIGIITTPRSVKFFINKLAGLNTVWRGSNIPLHIMAGFLVAIEVNDSDSRTEKSIYMERDAYLNSLDDCEDKYKYFAMLYYNVDQDEVEGIVSQQAFSALVSKNSDDEEFIDILEKHKNNSTFKEMITDHYLLGQLWEGERSHTLDECLAFDKITKIIEIPRYKQDYIWDKIKNGLSKDVIAIDGDKNTPEKATRTQKLIIDHFEVEDPEIYYKVLKTIGRINKGLVENHLIPWLEVVDNLFEFIRKKKGDEYISKHFSILCSHDDYVKFLRGLSSLKPKPVNVKYLKTTHPIVSIVKGICSSRYGALDEKELLMFADILDDIYLDESLSNIIKDHILVKFASSPPP